MALALRTNPQHRIISTPLASSRTQSAMTAPVTETSLDPEASQERTDIHEPRLWRSGPWTARVIKNEDDDGWAVAMVRQGESEPALVGPWTMGRDKKNPKPLDKSAFSTLVKTASEVIRRHEQAVHSALNKNLSVEIGGVRIRVALQIVPDEDDAYALLSAQNTFGEELAQVRVAPNFKLNTASATAWVEAEFRKPA